MTSKFNQTPKGGADCSYNVKDRNNWTSIFMKATIVQMMLASALTLFLLVGIIGPLRLLSVISYNASDSLLECELVSDSGYETGYKLPVLSVHMCHFLSFLRLDVMLT
jgi:hypothetical protein